MVRAVGDHAAVAARPSDLAHAAAVRLDVVVLDAAVRQVVEARVALGHADPVRVVLVHAVLDHVAEVRAVEADFQDADHQAWDLAR